MHYNSVNEVLDDMIGVNYAITQVQIEGIRALCKDAQVRQRNNLRNVLIRAYEAGRKHDREEYLKIRAEIADREYNLTELGGDE
ncbi:MAG: hypothetical protein Q4A32_00895 [Lachnospiraceae bacterium]|nr:hypothetical protein [Lachnospiraceae bacterium]